MMRVERAVLCRVFGFGGDGAAAAFGGMAVNLVEKWLAAVRRPAMIDAQRAAGANSGAGWPLRVLRERADSPEPGTG